MGPWDEEWAHEMCLICWGGVKGKEKTKGSGFKINKRISIKKQKSIKGASTFQDAGKRGEN